MQLHIYVHLYISTKNHGILIPHLPAGTWLFWWRCQRASWRSWRGMGTKCSCVSKGATNRRGSTDQALPPSPWPPWVRARWVEFLQGWKRLDRLCRVCVGGWGEVWGLRCMEGVFVIGLVRDACKVGRELKRGCVVGGLSCQFSCLIVDFFNHYNHHHHLYENYLCHCC